MKIPKVVERVASYCVHSCSAFYETLDEVDRIMNIENDLALASNCMFVVEFRPIAWSIAATKAAPNTDTYIALAREAINILLLGVKEEDVLIYFKVCLEKARRKI